MCAVDIESNFAIAKEIVAFPRFSALLLNVASGDMHDETIEVPLQPRKRSNVTERRTQKLDLPSRLANKYVLAKTRFFLLPSAVVFTLILSRKPDTYTYKGSD